jgi:hypothetical protein
MQQFEGDGLHRRVMPEPGPDGVRRWDHGHGGAVEASASDDFQDNGFPTYEVVGAVIAKCVGQLDRKFQAALTQRDEKIQALEQRLDIEIALEHKLTAIKSELAEAQGEIAETRRLAPNFNAKLNILEGRIEKLTKQTVRLRAGHSTLEYQQRESGKQIRKTKFEVTNVGATTREILQQLQASGFDLMGEMPSPSLQ